MGRRAVIISAGIPIVGIVAIYQADHALAINILAIVILLLPVLDFIAGIVLTTLYLSRPAGHRSVSLGISTLVTWQTVAGLTLTALPAFNRIAARPPTPYGDLLVALGFTLIGMTPIYLAGWIVLERRRRGDGTPPPEDGHLW